MQTNIKWPLPKSRYADDAEHLLEEDAWDIVMKLSTAAGFNSAAVLNGNGLFFTRKDDKDRWALGEVHSGDCMPMAVCIPGKARVLDYVRHVLLANSVDQNFDAKIVACSHYALAGTCKVIDLLPRPAKSVDELKVMIDLHTGTRDAYVVKG